MLGGQRIQIVTNILVALYVNLLLDIIIVSIVFSGTFCCAGVSLSNPKGCFIKINEELGAWAPAHH